MSVQQQKKKNKASYLARVELQLLVPRQKTGFLIVGELIWQPAYLHTLNTYTDITHTNTLRPLASAPGGLL